jgi:hypothetical protein
MPSTLGKNVSVNRAIRIAFNHEFPALAAIALAMLPGAWG